MTKSNDFPTIPLRSARSVALHVLLEIHQHQAFVQELLDTALRQSSLSDADRRLATQLAYGVLRRRGTLDAVLSHLVKRPRQQVEVGLWDVLRLGAYQIIFLTQIPDHAAVHETVDLANALKRSSAKGFLNGVLRALTRLMTEETVDKPSASALPIHSWKHRCFAKAVFADPKRQPAEYLSQALSLPLWMVRRWLERDGFEECLRLGLWFADAAPIWLRCNPLKADRETCLKKFQEAEIDAEPGTHPQSIRLLSSHSIADLPGFQDGWLTVQDESAMNVSTALNPTPGARILDLCAAPGGKTTHLAELMHNQGEIIACDVDEKRLQLVDRSAERLGIDIIKTRFLNLNHAPDLPKNSFDAVLVDVPCSNTGVLGKRPEARWRLRADELSHLREIQLQLMQSAAELVKPEGMIVYSTCSIEPDENQELIRLVLKTNKELVLQAESDQVPGRPADGGYWAQLQRISAEE